MHGCIISTGCMKHRSLHPHTHRMSPNSPGSKLQLYVPRGTMQQLLLQDRLMLGAAHKRREHDSPFLIPKCGFTLLTSVNENRTAGTVSPATKV